MSRSKYIKAVIARAILLSALGCRGQIITPAATGVQGPDKAGKCWVNYPKSYQDLSFLEKGVFKAVCKKKPDACDTSMFGSKKVGVACPAPPKPAALPDSKPAPAAPPAANSKPLELCPPSSTRVEGKPYCLKDGALVDVVVIPAAPNSSTGTGTMNAPAPAANTSQSKPVTPGTANPTSGAQHN